MKIYKLLLTFFLGINIFPCSGETFYKLYFSEESSCFFNALKSKHLTGRGSDRIDLFHIDKAKCWYGSNANTAILGHAIDCMDRFLHHNDRNLSDCYRMAFWLVYLKENAVPMNEACKQGVERLLVALEKDLQYHCSWGTFNPQEVDKAFRGSTFQPVDTSRNSSTRPPSNHVQQQPCLLL
ncbi:MAG: hypothetical protein LBH52_01275 [Puniceicoccales bacterium]|jgi:hypothetical protein|nr:hypothetical protein [Puniceicoccales bacterium]